MVLLISGPAGDQRQPSQVQNIGHQLYRYYMCVVVGSGVGGLGQHGPMFIYIYNIYFNFRL